MPDVLFKCVKGLQCCTDLDQGAAAPLSARQPAAGRSRGAAALVVTFNVRHGARLGHGTQFGEPGYDAGALCAGGPVRLATVAAGAAVVPITTAHRLRSSKHKCSETAKSSALDTGPVSAYVWQRAAAPSVGLLHEAAGRLPGAAGLGVTHVPGWSSWTGNGPTGLLLQGGGLLEPGQAEAAGLVASLFSHVAFVAAWTAVLVIAAAHGLESSEPVIVFIFLPPKWLLLIVCTSNLDQIQVESK